MYVIFNFYASASIDRRHIVFWPVCLSVRLFVCPQKLLHLPYLLICTTKAFIFHINIPCDKTFLLVPSSRSSVKVKVKYEGQSLHGHLCFSNTAYWFLILLKVLLEIAIYQMTKCWPCPY